MTIVSTDFAHPALFTQTPTSRRGVARLVFDDIPNFGMTVLPPRYIAGVRVRELRLWSNVPEPEIDLGAEENSEYDEDEDSEDDEGEDAFECDCDYCVAEGW